MKIWLKSAVRVGSSLGSKLALPLILLTGLLLRIYNLTGKPLWYDEACSVAYAQKPLQYFFGHPQTFNYKTLYFLILKQWIAMFGTGEYAIRLLSVLFGVFSIYVIYKLAHKLYNHRVAIWSAFLLSISTFHIYHCQQTRQYSLVVMLSLMSFYLFVSLFSKQRVLYAFLNGIVNFLLLNTHPYTILIIGVQCFLLFVFYKRISKIIFLKWLVIQSVGVVLYFLGFLLPSLYYLQEKVWWIHRPKISILAEAFLTFMFGGPRYGLDDYKTPLHLLPLFSVFSIPFLCLFLNGIGAFSIKKTKGPPVKINIFTNAILLFWFFAPLIVAYLVSYLKALFLIKHLIYLLPPFLILIAKGIESIERTPWRICLVSLVILSSPPSLYTLYNYDDNIDWRRPAEYIHSELKSNETIIICSSKEVVPFLYHFAYRNKDGLKKIDIYGQWSNRKWEEIFKYDNINLVGIRQSTPGKPADPFEDFEQKYAENKFFWRDQNLWMAVSRWGKSENFSMVEKMLGKTHLNTIEKMFDGVTVYYWKKL